MRQVGMHDSIVQTSIKIQEFEAIGATMQAQDTSISHTEYSPHHDKWLTSVMESLAPPPLLVI